jgi:hypothetical protein
MGSSGSFLNFGEKGLMGVSVTCNLNADQLLQAQGAASKSSRSKLPTSGVMKGHLAAVRFRGGSSESDDSGSPTREEEPGSDYLSGGNSGGSGSGRADIDRAFPRGRRVEHSEIPKFQVLRRRQVCNEKRVCVFEKVEILDESCFAGSKLDWLTFENESRLM